MHFFLDAPVLKFLVSHDPSEIILLKKHFILLSMCAAW